MKHYGKLVPPVLTTTERNALSAVDTSSIIYNSTTVQYEYWDGLTWKPLVDYSNITTTPLGSVDLHSDVDTSTVMPIAGDSLNWNGTNWVPSSATATNSANYVFAYDTSSQIISVANTYQDVNFSTNGQINNWTHTPGTANFIAGAPGVFVATAEVIVQKAGSGSPVVSIRSLQNGIEVPGTNNGINVTSNNTAYALSRTFIFSTLVGEIFKVQVASNTTTPFLIGAPAVGNIAEVRDVTTTVGTNLGGKYWTIYAPGLGFYIWYNTGASVDPAPGGGLIGIPVSILAADSANQVASKTATVFTTNSMLIANFSTAISSNKLTITNLSAATVTDSSAATSGFTVTTTTQGVGTPSPSATLTVRRLT